MVRVEEHGAILGKGWSSTAGGCEDGCDISGACPDRSDRERLGNGLQLIDLRVADHLISDPNVTTVLIER